MVLPVPGFAETIVLKLPHGPSPLELWSRFVLLKERRYRERHRLKSVVDRTEISSGADWLADRSPARWNLLVRASAARSTTRNLRPEDNFQGINYSGLFTNIENDEFSRLVEVRGFDPRNYRSADRAAIR